MKKWTFPLIVVGLVLAVLATRPGDRSGEPLAPVDPMTGRSEFNIPPQDSKLVAEGEVVYQATCAACHGADLRGTAVGPSFLSVIYNPFHHSDEAFVSAARNGVPAHHWDFGDMAKPAPLSDQELIRVIAFARESQRLEGFEAYPPP